MIDIDLVEEIVSVLADSDERVSGVGYEVDEVGNMEISIQVLDRREIWYLSLREDLDEADLAEGIWRWVSELALRPELEEPNIILDSPAIAKIPTWI
jgi:hypothetical protein